MSDPSHFDAAAEGAEIYKLAAALYPICRSITGEGVRQSLRLLQKQAPLQLHEVATGTKVFDWTVPNEWNLREAWIKNAAGIKIVDTQRSNLHVVNYSIPIRKKLSLAELRPHLHSLPEQPDWIPYRTSYYKENWGFCLTHRQLESLPEGEYEVGIDSSLVAGNLTYGEYRVAGRTNEEVLFSTHCCHPSLANDNLSGMAVAARLARLLTGRALRYSYRFIWIPGTIGSITWLATHPEVIPKIKHGLVLSCLGDAGGFTYKRTRGGRAEIDRVVEHVLHHSGHPHSATDFTPYGYDERQYCSPGIKLPVGCFMRTPNGKYPQYHTSADDLNLISAASLGQSVQALLNVIEVLEGNARFVNLNPKCEPQLGRRGLYRQMGGTASEGLEEAMLWVLNFSDGDHSLLDIAERSGLLFRPLAKAAEMLEEAKLLERDPKVRA